MAPVASANTAGLVVVHGDGSSLVRVVNFAEESITGVELLRRSGLAISTGKGSAGEAVYMIDHEGDPNGWVTKDGQTYYWGYYTRAGGWKYSAVGAGAAKVADGDIQAWVWQSYGQKVVIPAVSISEMGVMVESGTPTAKKPANTAASGTGFKWGYVVFGVILLGLVVLVVDRMRPRIRRGK
jgi:hypothetical protein